MISFSPRDMLFSYICWTPTRWQWGWICWFSGEISWKAVGIFRKSEEMPFPGWVFCFCKVGLTWDVQEGKRKTVWEEMDEMEKLLNDLRVYWYSGINMAIWGLYCELNISLIWRHPICCIPWITGRSTMVFPTNFVLRIKWVENVENSMNSEGFFVFFSTSRSLSLLLHTPYRCLILLLCAIGNRYLSWRKKEEGVGRADAEVVLQWSCRKVKRTMR